MVPLAISHSIATDGVIVSKPIMHLEHKSAIYDGYNKGKDGDTLWRTFLFGTVEVSASLVKIDV